MAEKPYHIIDAIHTKELAEKKIKTLPIFCHSFFNHMHADNYSEKTILNYACDLEIFFRFLCSENPTISSINEITPEILDQLTYEDMDEFKIYSSYLRDKEGTIIKPADTATVHRHLGTLRSFFKFCHGRKIIRQNPMMFVTNPKRTEKSITYLEPNEITDMLVEVTQGNHLTDRQRKFCKKATQRDYAIILTLVSTGLRVSELVGLNTTSIDRKNNAFYVHRKGNKEQFVYFTDEVLKAIDDYINGERTMMNPDNEALFLSNRGTRITVRSVERIVSKYTQSSEVTIKHITPHKLRSTFGTNLYRETGDIYLTADALNHKNVSTTIKHYSAQSDSNRKKVKEIEFIKTTQQSVDITKEKGEYA